MKFACLNAAFATALLAFAPVVASAAHIDFFEDGGFNLTVNSASPAQTSTLTQSGLPQPTVLGRQRVDTLTRTQGGNNAAVSATLQSTGTGGNADDNDVWVSFSGNGNARGSLLFDYGLGGDLNANFLDIPNSVNDWDRIRVTFGANSSPIDVRVNLFSRESGGLFSQTLAYAGSGASNLNHLDFFYASFGSSAGLSNDFLRNIDQVSLFLGTNASTSNNFSVTLLSFNRNGSVAPAVATVPEPGTLMLFGLALTGLMVTSRRRSR